MVLLENVNQHFLLSTAENDCAAMREDQQIIYANPGSQPARYLVGLVTLPFTSPA